MNFDKNVLYKFILYFVAIYLVENFFTQVVNPFTLERHWMFFVTYGIIAYILTHYVNKFGGVINLIILYIEGSIVDTYHTFMGPSSSRIEPPPTNVEYSSGYSQKMSADKTITFEKNAETKIPFTKLIKRI